MHNENSVIGAMCLVKNVAQQCIHLAAVIGRIVSLDFTSGENL